jgi:hypothetical protein
MLSITSNLETVYCKYGFGKLDSGHEFTLAPLWDSEHDCWARLNYRDSLIALDRLGMRMPTFNELDQIASREDAIILQPVTLVRTKEDSLKMGSWEFWQKHDEKVAKQIADREWDEKVPLVSVGKHWAAGAPAGRAWLHGWYLPKKDKLGNIIPGYSGIIQKRGTSAHDNKHLDYSSTIICVSKEIKKDKEINFPNC